MTRSGFVKYFAIMKAMFDYELAQEATPTFFGISQVFHIDFSDVFSARAAVETWRKQGLVWYDSTKQKIIAVKLFYDKSVDERNAGRYTSGLYGRM